jgi:hypothetical protein
MGTMPADKIVEWHAKYGPIIKIRFGVQTWHSISDPNIAQELFVTEYGSDTAGRPYNAYGSKYYSYGKKYVHSSILRVKKIKHDLFRGIVFADGTTQWKKARAASNDH